MALAVDIVPDAVIGDLDSLDPDSLARLPADRLHRIAEQDSTDFDKALRHIDAPLVLAVGFTGARLDHELAVYNALVRLADRRAIVVGEHDICFHAPPALCLDLPLGTRVSLFPMASVTGRSTGLRWPIEGLRFAPDGRVGTSNIVSAAPVTLAMDAPGTLVILPRAMLRAAIRALVPG
jgi:thiamine pyrophosphokinase